MKIRIKDNHLRLRLTRSEVEAFAQNGRVARSIQFAPGRKLEYVLEKSDRSPQLSADFHENRIIVLVPADEGQSWAESEQVGMEARVDHGQPEVLHVLVEKDFQCLHRDKAEEPDNYPHPLQS
jgi:hypothetical protein